MTRDIAILLGALCCLAPVQPVKAADGCPDLQGKDAAAHLEYLRGDRSKLSPKCIASAMVYIGAKRYTQASAVLIQYLDYRDPDSQGRADKRAAIPYAYRAVSALYGLGTAVVPELTAVISATGATELVRRNAAYAIASICGIYPPEGIATLVRAAHAETDPIAASHLMDQARWLAASCIPAWSNDCENAVLK